MTTLFLSPGFGAAPYGAVPFGSSLEDAAPYISNWSPFIGAAISRVGVIEFDVTDDYGLASVSVRAVFPTGGTETIFTDRFTELYRRSSARIAITDGYHFVLRRQGGWPKYAVRIDVTALDLAGNVGTGQAQFP